MTSQSDGIIMATGICVPIGVTLCVSCSVYFIFLIPVGLTLGIIYDIKSKKRNAQQMKSKGLVAAVAIFVPISIAFSFAISLYFLIAIPISLLVAYIYDKKKTE